MFANALFTRQWANRKVVDGKYEAKPIMKCRTKRVDDISSEFVKAMRKACLTQFPIAETCLGVISLSHDDKCK